MGKLCPECLERFEFEEQEDYGEALQHWLVEHPNEELQEILNDVVLTAECVSCYSEFSCNVNLDKERGKMSRYAFCEGCRAERPLRNLIDVPVSVREVAAGRAEADRFQKSELEKAVCSE